jgi:hypothetical protein
MTLPHVLHMGRAGSLGTHSRGHMVVVSASGRGTVPVRHFLAAIATVLRECRDGAGVR